MSTAIDWQNLKAHPAADLFPRMVGSDLESLAISLKQDGQLFPVILTKDGDAILDGRNRIAAHKLDTLKGKEPWIEVYRGTLKPTDYVRCVNWERMHLSQSQRAALAVLLIPDETRAANERKLSALKNGKSSSASPDANGKAAEVVAKKMNVSPAQVERAARLQKENPEAFEKVKEGKASVKTEHSKLQPKRPSPVTKSEAEQAFSNNLAEFFTALSALDRGFEKLNLGIRELPKLESDTRGRYLSAAIQHNRNANLLILKLQGK